MNSISLLLSKLKPTAALTEGRLVLFMHLTQNQWYSWISIGCIMSVTLRSLILHQTTLKDCYSKAKVTGEVSFEIMRYLQASYWYEERNFKPSTEVTFQSRTPPQSFFFPFGCIDSTVGLFITRLSKGELFSVPYLVLMSP